MLDEDLKPYFPGAPKSSVIGDMKLQFKRPINEELIDQINNFIDKSMTELSILGFNKIILGLSGGLDSAIAASLLQTKFADISSVLILELDENEKEDTQFAVGLAKKIGIKYEIINACKLYAEHLNLIPTNNLGEDSILAKIHLRSRLINDIVFQIADNRSAAVIDTTDKSEQLLSIYAESFRGHIAPLIALYKSELYDMADYFSLSEIKEKKSGCPQLLDFDAFGVEWEVLDSVLYLLIDNKYSVNEIAKEYDIDLTWLNDLQKRIQVQPVRTETRRIVLPQEPISV